MDGCFFRHLTLPHVYQHEGLQLHLLESLSKLTSVPRDWCPMAHGIVEWNFLFCHRFLHASEKALDMVWNAYSRPFYI